MLVLKVWYRVAGFFLKIAYRIIYGHRVRWGKGFHVRKGFQATSDAGGVIVFGDNVFFNNYCSVHARCSISIGSETIFGENVHIYDHDHRFANPDVPIKDQGYSEKPVVIGSHCWIGSSVVILKGVTIGDNVVIGAGCVISSDILRDSVVRQERTLMIEGIRR